MNIVLLLNTIAGVDISWSNRALECIVGGTFLLFLIFTGRVLYFVLRIGSGHK